MTIDRMIKLHAQGLSNRINGQADQLRRDAAELDDLRRDAEPNRTTAADPANANEQ